MTCQNPIEKSTRETERYNYIGCGFHWYALIFAVLLCWHFVFDLQGMWCRSMLPCTWSTGNPEAWSTNKRNQDSQNVKEAASVYTDVEGCDGTAGATRFQERTPQLWTSTYMLFWITSNKLLLLVDEGVNPNALFKLWQSKTCILRGSC